MNWMPTNVAVPKKHLKCVFDLWRFLWNLLNNLEIFNLWCVGSSLDTWNNTNITYWVWMCSNERKSKLCCLCCSLKVFRSLSCRLHLSCVRLKINSFCCFFDIHFHHRLLQLFYMHLGKANIACFTKYNTNIRNQ